uniref:hypothetical protein n=1 Tax=Treponema sp. TaxID=166 RepID=UPI00388CFC7C
MKLKIENDLSAERQEKLKNRFMLLLASALAFIFASCDIPANSNSSVSVDPNTGATDEISAADTSNNSDSGKITVDALDDFDDFVLGFDASAVDYYENNGD